MGVFESLLFATDFSKVSERILRLIPDLGARKVTLVHVINPASVVWIRRGFNIDEWICSEIEESCRRLSSMAEFLESRGIEVKYTYFVGDPATEIVNAARRERVSAIIMGDRGRSVSKDIRLGSVAEGVIRRTDVPVIIVRNGVRIRRIALIGSADICGFEVVRIGGENPDRILELLSKINVDALAVSGLNACHDAIIRHCNLTVIYLPNSSLIPGSI